MSSPLSKWTRLAKGYSLSHAALDSVALYGNLLAKTSSIPTVWSEQCGHLQAYVQAYVYRACPQGGIFALCADCVHAAAQWVNHVRRQRDLPDVQLHCLIISILSRNHVKVGKSLHYPPMHASFPQRLGGDLPAHLHHEGAQPRIGSMGCTMLFY